MSKARTLEVQVVIDVENDAFYGENRAFEVSRILRELADNIESGQTTGIVRDINGNSVGRWLVRDPKS